MKKKLKLGLFVLSLITFADYKVEGFTLTPCKNLNIPCGPFDVLFETWCVNAGANTNLYCYCGAPPFDPCLGGEN